MKKLIFNWKMNVNYPQIKSFVDSLSAPLDERFVFLPTYLGTYNLLANADKKVNAFNVGFQNVSAYPSGDYTGDVSFLEARELGIDYILVNHSEVIRNRVDEQIFGNLNYKLKVLIENEFKPIVCLGNEFKENVEDIEKVIGNELKKLFHKIEFYDSTEIVIVYIPYFYANNNITISNRTIETQMQLVKQVLVSYFGDFIANNQITLVYGGPVEKVSDQWPAIDGLFLEDWNDQEYVKKLIKTFNGKK